MRILIFEHICSGGLAGQPLDTRLMTKGGAMLRAVTEDFHAAGHDVTALLDQRVPLQLPGKTMFVEPSAAKNAVYTFEESLHSVDAALVIAPEFADILPDWLARIERSGVQNLGSSSHVVRATSDKYAMAFKLAARGIKTPKGAIGLQNVPHMLQQFGELIIKPNQGAGCIDTFICRSEADIQKLPHRTDWLVQERIRGIAASAAFVIPAPGKTPIPLRAGRQTIGSADAVETFKLNYSGGELPLPADLEQRAINLGLAALPHFPGLRGMVGIDLILGAAPAQDTLIEVNPRPTVAYTGLRQLALFHIPDLILAKPIAPSWRNGGVRYKADGSFQLIP